VSGSDNRVAVDRRIALSLAGGLAAFAFAPILVRFAQPVNPFTLAAWRTSLAALLILPFWIRHRRNVRRQTVYEKGDRLLTALAGVSLGIHFTFWIASLKYTSVASASVLVTMHPVLLIVLESLLFRVRFSWMSRVGVVLAVGGSVLLVLMDHGGSGTYPDPLLGDLLAFTAAIVFTIYLLIGRRLRPHRDWIDYVGPVYTWAAIACLVMVLLSGARPGIHFRVVSVGFGLALGPQVIGHGAINYAVRYISPTLLSTLILAEPLLATGLAYVFFHEQPSPGALVVMTLIIGGIALTWFRKAEPVAV